MDVSVIIVSYNTKELLVKCIESIYQFTQNVSFEIIISDNGSNDGTIPCIKKDYPGIILLENGNNTGFAVANNRALKVAKGKYVLFLNSDAYFLGDVIHEYIQFWESNRSLNIFSLGMLMIGEYGEDVFSGGKIPTYYDMCFEQGIRIIKHVLKSIFPRTITRLKSYKNSKSNETSDVEWDYKRVGFVSGADLFVENNMNAFFDDHFFMYFEDTDLQLNMSRNGLNSYVINKKIIAHYKPNNPPFISPFSITDRYKMESSLYFCKKNYNKVFLIKTLILVELLLPKMKCYREEFKWDQFSLEDV